MTTTHTAPTQTEVLATQVVPGDTVTWSGHDWTVLAVTGAYRPRPFLGHRVALVITYPSTRVIETVHLLVSDTVMVTR